MPKGEIAGAIGADGGNHLPNKTKKLEKLLWKSHNWTYKAAIHLVMDSSIGKKCALFME